MANFLQKYFGASQVNPDPSPVNDDAGTLFLAGLCKMLILAN